MDIREKTLAQMIAIFAVVTIMLLFLSQTILLDSYRAIESNDIGDDIGLILDNINSEFASLETSTLDWAKWDDMYAFARGENPAFVKEYLEKDTYDLLHLNFIVITNTGGNIIYGQSYNFTDSSFSPLPPELAREIAKDSSYLLPADNSGTSGFLALPDTTAMVASFPILRNDLSGPPAGTLIMGRYLDESEMRTFGLGYEPLPSISTVTPVVALPSGEPVPADLRKPAVQVSLASEEIIEGRTILRDINGNDVLVLSFQKPRDFYQQGKQTIEFFIAVQLAIMLLLGFFIIYRIDRSVLTRLNRIINDTYAVSQGSSRRIQKTGDDEIAQLAEAMNQMLGQLEQSHTDLQDSEQKFRSFVQESADGYILLGSQGQVIEWNPANERITGIAREEALGVPFIEIQIRLLVPEHRTPQFIEHLRQESTTIVNTGEFPGFYQPMEIGIARPDGTRRTLQQISFPLRISGELHFGIINRDITESRLTEDALRQSRKKLNLLNTITFQDIRSTSFALSGYHELIRKYINSEDGKNLLKKEELLLQQINKSLNVAKNYQDLGINLPLWQDVNRVFLYALSHLDSLKITRTVRLDGLEVFADPLLEKVFSNLLENAVQRGGGVTSINLTCQKRETGLELIFEDNGRGIPSGEKEKIFEREYRDIISLFFAREILSITGMSIRETGVEGEGARFIIMVPEAVYRFHHDPL